jgi:hypothetical protein
MFSTIVLGYENPQDGYLPKKIAAKTGKKNLIIFEFLNK